MLSFDQKIAIFKQVVLQAPPPKAESQEAAQFRAGLTQDYLKAKAEGLVLLPPRE